MLLQNEQGFLALPAELRLKIYNYISDQLESRSSTVDFQGLYLSNHQVMNEMEDECIKRRQALIKRARDSWTFEHIPLNVSSPRTFAGMKDLIITVARSGFYDVDILPKPFLELLSLPLHSLIIRLLPLSEEMNSWDDFFDLFDESVTKTYTNKFYESRFLRADSVVLDLGKVGCCSTCSKEILDEIGNKFEEWTETRVEFEPTKKLWISQLRRRTIVGFDFVEGLLKEQHCVWEADRIPPHRQ